MTPAPLGTPGLSPARRILIRDWAWTIGPDAINRSQMDKYALIHWLASLFQMSAPAFSILLRCWLLIRVEACVQVCRKGKHTAPIVITDRSTGRRRWSWSGRCLLSLDLCSANL